MCAGHVARVDAAVQAEHRHPLRWLGETAGHAQHAHAEARRRSGFSQRLGLQLAAMVDGAWQRLGIFIDPAATARHHRMAIQRRGAGQHEAACTGLAGSLQQVCGRLHIDLLEYRIRHQADMGCVQGGGMDHRVDALHCPLHGLTIGDIGNDAGGGEWAAIQPHHFVGRRQRAEDRTPDPPGTAGQQNLH